jgi:hypothetical protein
MAITINKSLVTEGSGYAAAAGQTNGNEVIFKIDPGLTYVVDCQVTSAGTASLEVTTTTDEPADFTPFSIAFEGTQAVNFSREVTGCSYVGLDIASGTWTVRVRRV